MLITSKFKLVIELLVCKEMLCIGAFVYPIVVSPAGAITLLNPILHKSLLTFIGFNLNLLCVFSWARPKFAVVVVVIVSNA